MAAKALNILKKNKKKSTFFGVFLNGVSQMKVYDEVSILPAFFSVLKDRNFHLVLHPCVLVCHK